MRALFGKENKRRNTHLKRGLKKSDPLVDVEDLPEMKVGRIDGGLKYLI